MSCCSFVMSNLPPALPETKPFTSSGEGHRILIRPSLDSDLPAVTAIYAHHVRHGTGSFELTPPDEAEMSQRRRDVLSKGWPFLVAERDGRVLGWAYANQLRPRPAFRFALEDSIYIAPEAAGQGLGRHLLAELMARCEAGGARQMVAIIGDSDNHGSIRLHAAAGFAHVGVLAATGWKFGRWLDTVFMQRALGPGASSTPDGADASSTAPLANPHP